MKQLVVHQIQSSVLNWYKARGRHDLPWRNLNPAKIDIPYAIMVAEFMLQQTQAERVGPKYTAFLHYFPTIKKLAQAKPALVITLWSGLGYNRRAVLLHKWLNANFGGFSPSGVHL